MHRIRRCLVALATLATATAIAPAVAGAAGPTSCPQYEEILRSYAPAGGWDVAQMSTIIARESGCVPTAKSARDSGLLQINQVNYAYLTNVLKEPVTRESLADPVQNIRAGAALCTYWQGRGESCSYPWKLDLYRPPAPAAAPAPTPPRPPRRRPSPDAARSTKPCSPPTPRRPVGTCRRCPS